MTEPAVKANAKDLNLKAKAKTKDLITEAKPSRPRQGQGLEYQGEGQGHAILSSRRLEAKEVASRTPTLSLGKLRV